MSEDDPKKPVYAPLQLRPTRSRARPPPVFETVRRIDIDRMRRRLLRAQPSPTRPPPWLAAAAELCQTVARLSEARTPPPEVVVIRTTASGTLRFDYSVVGGCVFLGDHLSPAWHDGEESLTALQTLRRALDEYLLANMPAAGLPG